MLYKDNTTKLLNLQDFEVEKIEETETLIYLRYTQSHAQRLLSFLIIIFARKISVILSPYPVKL